MATYASKPAGSGANFKKLAGDVGSKKLAAWIGRRKYGNRGFAALSKKGKSNG